MQKRNANKSSSEIFREKIALRQCLWTYWLQVKQGKRMTDEDRELVKETFISNAEFAESAFEEEEKAKAEHSDLLAELRDEAMEILNARNMKQLKSLKPMILSKKYSKQQRIYLKKLYVKRRERLQA